MDSKLTLTSLHWEDILFAKILPYLTLNDLFSLRATSKQCEEMIEKYFSKMKNLEINKFNFSVLQFKILSRTCHNLRTLVIHECDSVAQDDLKYLLDNNLKIRHIDLTRCCKLNSLCLHPVAVHFKDLNALILNHCIWFTTGCLEAFTLHHSKLQMLELSHCSSLGNVPAINSFLMKCKDLHTLNLSGINCICDSTMETLSHYNFKLRNLDVSYCTRITGYGIRMLVEYCKELRNLKLFGCSSAVQKLAYERAGFPSNVLTLKISIDYDVIHFMSGIPRIMAQV